MKSTYLYFTLIGLLTSSCITEIRDFEQIDSNSFLTVEAILSNQSGPHKVLISTSSPSITVNFDNTPIKRAIVYLTDDKNGRENLTEIIDGTYLTSANFKGIVGNTYILHINLPNGKNYQSKPEVLLASPLIDKIESKFVVKTNYPLTDSRSVGYDVTLNFKDSPTPNQYYQWKWTHYERTVYCAICANGFDFDKGKCAIILNNQGSNVLINYQCSETCFDIDFSSTYNILSDNLLNGQQITNYPIARVPYNNRSLYYLKIEQRAISEKLFKYFRSIKDATQNSGTLFDTPFETQFSPNIYSLSNANERIIGAFEVFGSQEKIIYVDRLIGSDKFLPVRRPNFGIDLSPSARASCTEGKYRTKKEPEDFRE
jgi:Domain of unknown function (DUF4249)